MGPIADNLAHIRQRIEQAASRAGRRVDQITLVAVSKTQSADMIREAYDAGQRDFGENYVQEAKEKIESLSDLSIRWHFIGHLQSNKARFVAPDYHIVHSVDTPKLAAALGKRAVDSGRVLPVLVEVNVSGEESKSGISPEAIRELVEVVAVTEGLSLRGLMTMPPFLPAEQVRPYFIALRNLRDRLISTQPDGASLDDLSMGMSGDFEVAIEEGSTYVRVGTSIFGSRR